MMIIIMETYNVPSLAIIEAQSLHLISGCFSIPFLGGGAEGVTFDMLFLLARGGLVKSSQVKSVNFLKPSWGN